MPRRVAHPSSFEQATADKVVSALRAGNYLETACVYAGLSSGTVRLWISTGHKDIKDGKDTLLAAFAKEVEQAQAESEVRDVMLIAKAAKDGEWTAAAWRLERKFPQRWGRRDRLDLGLGGSVTEIIREAFGEATKRERS